MLSDAVGALLPAAVAIALSPFPIVGVVLVLGTPRARTAGPAFAAGWVGGLAAVTSILVVALDGADRAGSDTETGVNWLTLAIGVLFLGMAAKQWMRRPTGGAEPEAPRWMASVAEITPVKAALLGVTLSSVNPKNLALVATGAATIAGAGLDTPDAAVAVAVFVGLASVAVAGAVVLYLIDADRAAAPLAAIKQFMSDNNAVIMMVVLLLLGAKFVGDGLGALT